MNPWLALTAGASAIALLAGAYFGGRHDGAAVERDKAAAIATATAKLRADREQLMDKLGAAAADRETRRQLDVKEIVRESTRIVDRPVYRNVCVDADGVRLLDAAAAAAGADPGGEAGSAGAGAAGAPNP